MRKDSRSGWDINHTHVHFKSFEAGPGNHGWPLQCFEQDVQ